MAKTDNQVTKEDLKQAFGKLEKNFVTKTYLDSKNFVTKTYLDSKNFVTKTYLDSKNFVTKAHLGKELKLLRQSINLDMDLKIRESEERTEERAHKRHSELLNLLDGFVKEVKDSREEREVSGQQIADHETRITQLENTVFA